MAQMVQGNGQLAQPLFPTQFHMSLGKSLM